jgi:segregation and condensation protein A
MPLHIRLSQFEGPLELLLSMIEDRKLDISRVSLSEVADQYLDRVNEERDQIDLENLASFLLIASRLILLKSKSLLPILEFTDEEEEEIEDLELRLREYKMFKEVATKLGERLSRKCRALPREKLLGAPNVYVPPKGLTGETLKCHFEDVLGAIPTKEEIIEEAVEEVVSLETRIEHLQQSLSTRAETSFRELSEQAENQMEVIVSFLAVLELVKQRFVSVRQKQTFGDIQISVSESKENVREQPA